MRLLATTSCPLPASFNIWYLLAVSVSWLATGVVIAAWRYARCRRRLNDRLQAWLATVHQVDGLPPVRSTAYSKASWANPKGTSGATIPTTWTPPGWAPPASAPPASAPDPEVAA